MRVKKHPSGLWVDEDSAPPPPPQREIVQGLPHWLQGVAYRGDDDIITIRVRVPASQLAQEHLLALEATPQGVRELIDALQRLVTRSEQTMQVVDVPSVISSP